MKKLTSILLVAFLVVALALPVVMAASPQRYIMIVATFEEIPEATADSPDFIYVQDEGITYAKYDDPVLGLIYIPEDQVPVYHEYEVIKGAEETWTLGSGEDFILASDWVSNRDLDEKEPVFDHFLALIIDGELVDESNYTAYEGSIEIKLNADFMETLEVGEHPFVIQADDGSAGAKFYVVASQSPTQGTETDTDTETETETEPGEVTGTETEPGEVTGTETEPGEVTGTETEPGEVTGTETEPGEVTDNGGNQPSQTGRDADHDNWIATMTAVALIALGAIGVVALALVKTRKSSDK